MGEIYSWMTNEKEPYVDSVQAREEARQLFVVKTTIENNYRDQIEPPPIRSKRKRTSFARPTETSHPALIELLWAMTASSEGKLPSKCH